MATNGGGHMEVLHEGWCVKESGTRFMGHHHWQKRWFRLTIQSVNSKPLLSYYKSRSDSQPAGSVQLDESYCTRPVEHDEKSKQNCFAVGPFVDDGLKRTYYISCDSEQDKLEWMEVIDAAIEGVPEQAAQRRQTVSAQFRQGLQLKRRETILVETGAECFNSVTWRLERWNEVNELAKKAEVWSKVDVKNGVTVARSSFGGEKERCAFLKVEGLAPASLFTMYRFLQHASEQGGKLDYPFRNEVILQKLEGEPGGCVFRCQYSVPWPRISPRDICAVRVWVPETCSVPPYAGTCGVLLHSVEHVTCPERKDVYRVQLGTSAVILKRHVDANGEQTLLSLVLQINTRASLQKMLKGAYKSGPLKIALRSGFQHIVEQLEHYKQVIGA